MDTLASSTSGMLRHPLIATLEAALASGRLLTADLSERLQALRCDFAPATSQLAAAQQPIR